MRIHSLIVAFVGCLLLAGTVRAQGFQRSLSSEQVDQAYSIGRDADRRQSFFDQYAHAVAPQPTGPDVHLIEFGSPYEQIARRAQEHWANYDHLDAEGEYAANPDQVVVRVLICGSQTFSFPQPQLSSPEAASWQDKDYLQGFVFRVSQAQAIQPEKFSARRTKSGCQKFDAVEAFLYFSTRQFERGSTQVEVIAPGGQTFATGFDLARIE